MFLYKQILVTEASLRNLKPCVILCTWLSQHCRADLGQGMEKRGPVLPCRSPSRSYSRRLGCRAGPVGRIPSVLPSTIHSRWWRGGASPCPGGLPPSLCISLPSGPSFLITCLPGDFYYWMLNPVCTFYMFGARYSCVPLSILEHCFGMPFNDLQTVWSFQDFL